MNTSRLIASTILFVAFSVGSTAAQQEIKLGENAALRYWSAFAIMQDSAITEQQAKELNAILDGTAPYDDSKYKDLIEKNRPALETLARATALESCDWGVDYQLRQEAPVDYVRKALALGRLNVLYAFHLAITGDRHGAVRALTTGLRFSHDVANGGTLFAAVVAKDLLVAHLTAVSSVLHGAGLAPAQRLALQKAVAQLGPAGVDWHGAMKREMEVLNRPDGELSVPLKGITQAYLSALSDSSTLSKLQQMIALAPQSLQDVIPNPKRVLEEEHDLTDKLRQMRSSLQ